MTQSDHLISLTTSPPTSLQTPLRTRAARTAALAAAALLATFAGCASGLRERPLTAPSVVAAPYSTSQGEAVLAVVPLRNETGDTMAPIDQVSEQLLAAVEEVRGIRTIPMSRTLMAMRALEFRGIRTPQELKALADSLGADGVVFGTVSSYDPYTPAVTLSIGLFARGERMGERAPVETLSTRELQGMGAEPSASPTSAALLATSTWSDHLDGKNNGVQMAVRSYAQGRQNGPNALGWRRYLASMPLFTEFATAEAVRGLMREEWVRVGGMASPDGSTANAGSSPSPGTTDAPRAQGTVTSAVDGAQ